MTDQLVKDNERIDDLQNGYYVIQDPDKFCLGWMQFFFPALQK